MLPPRELPMTDTSMPLLAAVQSALSDIEANANLPFGLESEAVFVEIIKDATDCDSEAPVNAALLVRVALLAFHSGYRAAHAQRDAEALEKLIAT